MKNQNNNFEKIIIECEDKNEILRKVSFFGNWIVKNIREDMEGMMLGTEYSVAITEKEKFFVLTEKSGCNEFSHYEVYDSFEDLVDDGDNIPPGIMSLVASDVGEEYIEELDI